jgi:putative glutamine amidotransferase
MTRPLIGITTKGRGDDGRVKLNARYVDAVRRAGGVPLLLPPGERELDPLLETLDGLVLTGGGDVDPALYGGRLHATVHDVDAERDASEIALARAADGAGLPTFGICRGAQVLNVALGGTLVEHLPDEVGETLTHAPRPGAGSDDYEHHDVRVAPGSRLATVLDGESCTTASWHHQAVRQVAPGLQVVAKADDGTIEAFEKREHPWLVAVQWHPEATAAGDPAQQRLFNAFVAAAAEHRRTRFDPR